MKTPADRDAVIVSARAQVQKLHTGLRAWGEKGIVARAPEFSQLALPSSGHRLLDAMSRYQVCTILLTTQLAGERDVPAKRAAAVALIGVTMAMVSLVPTLTTNGLTEGEIRAFMVGDRMSRATEGVLKGDVDVRAHVEAKCRPAVTSLIGLIG